MVTTVLGKVAITPKGEWNGTTAYEKLDVVSYNGSSYLSVRDVPSGTSLSNTNYWMLLAQKGDTGNAIASIEKTATSGLTDTYTITFTNGNTTTFTVTNGEAATVIVGTVTTGAEGTAVVITNSGDDHDAVLNFTIPRGNTGNGIQGIELTATSGSVKTYTITFTDGETFSFDVTDGEVTETRLSEALEDYARVDGYYEDLVSGGSEQLLSSVYEEDSEPYLFRTSGGSMDIGDREEDTIVGGTIAFNQLNKNDNSKTYNGVTFTANGDGTISVSGTPTARAYSYTEKTNNTNLYGVANHVFLSLINVITGSIPTDVYIGGSYYSDNGQTWIGQWSSTKRNTVFKVPSNVYSMNHTLIDITAYTVTVLDGGSVDFKVSTQLIDLTQMFGSTIADYIYSLEQANAGAGVSWFKKLFPKPYYAYNAGELLSVEGLQSHDMRGFNAWDEEWEVGGIDSTTGANITGSSSIRTKNYIPVFPNTVYYCYIGGATGNSLKTRWYDADKNYIGYNPSINYGATFTVPENAHYLRFCPQNAYGTTYNNDICINLHWDGERDGEYEPYVKHSYPLDSSLTLRGIPKLDSANKLYYDGDIYEADGTVRRKYGIVDLGTLNWVYVANWQGTNLFYVGPAALTPLNMSAANKNVICPKYTVMTDSSNIGNNRMYYNTPYISNTYPNIGISDESYTSAEAFKTAMSGVYLVYELATPTTEEAEPYQTPQIVDDFGTEEYVTDSIVPVGHVTKYMPNLKAKLEMAPDSPSDNGDYIVRHTNGQNEYVPLVIPTELPTAPSEAGTYHLKLTVANGTATLSWESES